MTQSYQVAVRLTSLLHLAKTNSVYKICNERYAVQFWVESLSEWFLVLLNY